MQIQYDQASAKNGLGRCGVAEDVKLIILKSIHTFIWLIMTTANFAAFYLALVGRFDWLFFFAWLSLVARS
jgi:hypothetical protein